MNQEITKQQAYKIFDGRSHTFNNSNFQLLNQDKVERLAWLVFEEEGKTKAGLVGGIKDGMLKSPFSSPFGGFNFLRPSVRLSMIQKAVDELIAWGKEEGLKAIRITLPPNIYETAAVDKQLNSLFIKGFTIQYIDLNYSYPLEHFDDHYIQNIKRNARKNLKAALRVHDYSFQKATVLEEQQEAYQVIAANRAAKGYPLHLSWEAIAATAEIIDIDFFLVRIKEEAVASAIVFHVAPGIVQVVYWGDAPGYYAQRPMNYLSYHVFQYYKGKVDTIDIGPSTEAGIPNNGLCEFKESIGCVISPKYTLIKEFK